MLARLTNWLPGVLRQPPILRVVMLIDADGVSPDQARAAALHLQERGRLALVRTYGSHSGRAKAAWSMLLQDLGAETRYTPVLVRGKNAADIALSIDATELLLTGSFDLFALIVSDSDYTPLAARIRSAGKLVVGYGQSSAPQPLRSACTEFVELGWSPGQMLQRRMAVRRWSLTPADAEPLVAEALEQLDGHRKWVAGSSLSAHLKKLYPGFDCRMFGRPTITRLLREMETVELVQHKNQIYVRLRPPEIRTG